MKYTVFLALTILLAVFLPQTCATNPNTAVTMIPDVITVECNANGAYIKVANGHIPTFMCGNNATDIIPSPDPTRYKLPASCLPKSVITISDTGSGKGAVVDFGDSMKQYAVSCTENYDGAVKLIQKDLQLVSKAPTAMQFTYKVNVPEENYGMTIIGALPQNTETLQSLKTKPRVVVSLKTSVFVTIYGANADVLIPINCTASQGSPQNDLLWSYDGTTCKKQNEVVKAVTAINGTGVGMTVFTMKAFQFSGRTGPVTVTCKVRVCTNEDIHHDGLCKQDNAHLKNIVSGFSQCMDITQSRKRSAADNMERGGRIPSLTAKMTITEDVGLTSGTRNYAISLVSGLLLLVLAMFIM